MQERRIDGSWSIDGSRDVSDYWTSVTQCTILGEKPPEVYIYIWSGVRLTKRQATSRPDHLWISGEERPIMVREAIEKPNLDDGRRSRRRYFTLRTRSSRKSFRMLEEKLETPMAPAMLCKSCKQNKHG